MPGTLCVKVPQIEVVGSFKVRSLFLFFVLLLHSISQSRYHSFIKVNFKLLVNVFLQFGKFLRVLFSIHCTKSFHNSNYKSIL